MPWIDGHTVRELVHPAHLVYVAHVEHRVDALGEQVQGDCDQVNVAGSLAVAEQSALDAVSTGHEAHLRGGHCCAAVVVRMQRQKHRGPVADHVVELLDHVGVEIRCRHLHRGGQIEDQRILFCWFEDIHDGFANLNSEVRLGAGVALGAVLPANRFRIA